MTNQAEYQYDVFISYSHFDRAWVESELLPQLEAAGLKVIIDYRDFEVGVPSLVNVERAVENSRHTLVILTPNWIRSEWAEFESLLVGIIDPASQQRKLLPLLLEPCELPLRLKTLTYADFQDPARRREEMSHLLRDVSVCASSEHISKRIFLSYKRDAEPDESVALEIYKALHNQHNVFIDKMMPVGTPWPKRIENEICQTDFLIALLSSESVHSEMVEREIALAHDSAKENGQRGPMILPVRLNYREPFPYPLCEYLNHINWAFWQNPEDTPGLIQELQQAISGGTLTIDQQAKSTFLQMSEPSLLPRPLPSAQPVRLEMPEGTMDPDSAFYIERTADRIALEAISRQGVTITIKGPRQMGKSSLLNRIIQAAAKEGKRTTFLDFQLIDSTALADPNIFFRQFCAWLTDELEIENHIDDCWKQFLSNPQRSKKYVEEYLLKNLGSPLLIAMDEVERIFDSSFRSDFFGMLRSWHNYRATKSLWKQLDMVLVTSTEPYLFVENLTQSPFNVGEVIELTDFALAQVSELNHRHGSPLKPEEERLLFDLLGGHPYLVRRALYLITSQQILIPELFMRATEEHGPFGDHLRNHLSRLYEHTELMHGLREVINHNSCQDRQVLFRLRGAGLVHEDGRIVKPRCRLYADFFKDRLSV